MSVGSLGADFCWMNGEVIETEMALVSARASTCAKRTV
jgi:hypothetical protein